MMNEKARLSVETYNAKAASLCATYNSLSTASVLPGIESVLPPKYRRLSHALDLGCGSGRDAFWLASKGFMTVGADASIEMIRSAWDNQMHASMTTYVEDQMPALSRVKKLNHRYDFYLMSAAWMHLDGDERKQVVSTMYDLAQRNATAYISLRHGPSPADRPMLETSVEELRDLAADNAAKCVVFAPAIDQQGRIDVTWDYVALQFKADKPHPVFV